LRGNKGDLHEGGIRVATIANWPGRLKPGKVSEPLHVVDWMPTLTGLAGFQAGRDVRWDGVNAWPHISGASNQSLTRALYWTTPRVSAVREGDWKLIVPSARGGATQPLELFNVAEDPRETTDLAAKRPEQVEALKARMAAVAKADRDSVVKE
jgi:arylsulfatase A-like enzyme